MKTIGSVLANIKLDKTDDSDKYLSREFQKYGIYLAEQLGDMSHKSLYIRLAKVTPRQILAEALTFVLDANAYSKGKLFMWKVKQIKDGQKQKSAKA